MATMRTLRIVPEKPLRVKLDADITSIEIRPDSRLEIYFRIEGSSTSGSMIVSQDTAFRLLGVGWEGK